MWLLIEEIGIELPRFEEYRIRNYRKHKNPYRREYTLNCGYLVQNKVIKRYLPLWNSMGTMNMQTISSNFNTEYTICQKFLYCLLFSIQNIMLMKNKHAI